MTAGSNARLLAGPPGVVAGEEQMTAGSNARLLVGPPGVAAGVES